MFRRIGEFLFPPSPLAQSERISAWTKSMTSTPLLKLFISRFSVMNVTDATSIHIVP